MQCRIIVSKLISCGIYSRISIHMYCQWPLASSVWFKVLLIHLQLHKSYMRKWMTLPTPLVGRPELRVWSSEFYLVISFFIVLLSTFHFLSTSFPSLGCAHAVLQSCCHSEIKCVFCETQQSKLNYKFAYPDLNILINIFSIYWPQFSFKRISLHFLCHFWKMWGY